LVELPDMPQTVKKKKGFFYYSWRGLGYLVRGFLRGLGLTFLLCFLLAVIAYVGLRATFDEERIKSVFVDQLQSRLRRPVQIDRVLLTPHGVKLRGVRVVEKPSVPGQYLLTSDAVLVTVKLSSLPRLRLDLARSSSSPPTSSSCATMPAAGTCRISSSRRIRPNPCRWGGFLCPCHLPRNSRLSSAAS